jgi:quercetin dioxygenase-like cupin family protein
VRTDSSPDLAALERQLRQEGFVRTYVWHDGPGAYYSEHTHDCETAHIILEGEMTLGQHGGQRTYRTGERCDVPAGAVHWARMGAAGCRYLIGER